MIDFCSGTTWNQIRGPSPCGIRDAVGADAELLLRRRRSTGRTRPTSRSRRWRFDDVVQRLGPEVRERLGRRAVDHQLVGHGHLTPPERWVPGDSSRRHRRPPTLAACARTRTSWSTSPRGGRRWSRRRCCSASRPRKRPTRPPTRCPGVAATGAGRAARRTSTRWSRRSCCSPRDAGRAPRRRAGTSRPSELLVLAPPTLEELRHQESVNNRATLRRAALIAVPLLLVGVGAGVYLGTTGDDGSRPSRTTACSRTPRSRRRRTRPPASSGTPTGSSTSTTRCSPSRGSRT